MVLRIDADWRMIHVIDESLREYVQRNIQLFEGEPCRCAFCLADLLVGEPHRDGCMVTDALEAIERIANAPMNRIGG